MESIKLTQFSKGAGCGCKIAPKELEKILSGQVNNVLNKNLLVGNETRDDAAVYDLGNGTALISSTDFFTPIVDDAFIFGQIAAANSISDIYAMGGKPILAIAILGWPVGKIPSEAAQQVIAGGKSICAKAGISLAGGHSIDCPEPFFGLAVNGLVEINRLKKNSTARVGNLLYLTKPLGSGIISTAEKRGIVTEAHKHQAIENMIKLNMAGARLSELKGVTAMTDITGFGLLGHLVEMCEGSGLSAELFYDKIPLMDGLDEYLKQMCYPDNTFRNWSAYSEKVNAAPGNSLFTLCDPQTNGGLLISLDPAETNGFEKIMREEGLGEFLVPVGKMKVLERENKLIYIS